MAQPARIGPEPIVVHFCRRGGPGSRGGESCGFCGKPMVALCDHRAPGARRRCSARLCEDHRVPQGPDLDACPNHAVAQAVTLGALLHLRSASPDRDEPAAPIAHDRATPATTQTSLFQIGESP